MPVPTVSPSSSAAPVPAEFSYTARWGDSLWDLAQRFGTTVEDIAERNGIVDYKLLRVGQILRIWGVPPATPSPPMTYIVQWGDNLSTLATRLGTTVEAIQRVNGIANPSLIYAGRVLSIPVGSDSPDVAATTSRRHTVRPGDTLLAIAREHNTTAWNIRVANNIPNPNWIYVGQVLIIP